MSPSGLFLPLPEKPFLLHVRVAHHCQEMLIIPFGRVFLWVGERRLTSTIMVKEMLMPTELKVEWGDAAFAEQTFGPPSILVA